MKEDSLALIKIEVKVHDINSHWNLEDSSCNQGSQNWSQKAMTPIHAVT